MKKILLYSGLCIAFLAIIFALNWVHVDALKNGESISDAPDESAAAEYLGDFSSHLPLIMIETNNQKILKDAEIYVEVSVLDEDINHPSDIPSLTADAVIKYRGNTSYYSFDKKQYRIEFKRNAESGRNAAYSMLGMPEAADWVLNGPFLDRTLTRSYLGFDISKKLLPWAPDTAYCELFVNGEYKGIYLLIEAITNEPGRLGMSELSLISGQCAYVVKMDRVAEEENPIETYGVKNFLISNEISVSYPTPANLNDLQKEFIIRDVSKFEEALYSDYFDNPETGYAKYIDIDDFVDYYIINEMMLVTDAGYFSTYFYKNVTPAAKLSITTWDFNNSYDNITYIKEFDQFYLVDGNWFKRLVQDKNFVDKIVTRYHSLRENLLSDEALIGTVDEAVAYLGDAVDRNFDLWGYTFYEKLLGSNQDPSSFNEAVAMLKDAIKRRGEFLDNNIEQLYEYCIN